MSKAMNFIMFAFGAAVGAVVTYRYVKKKYEQIAQEEIDSVKKTFHSKNIKVESQKAEEKADAVECSTILENNGYTNYSKNKKEETFMENQPYVISPEEFGEFDEYETISLVYYSNQVLADENDELVEDVESIVGFESLTHFGEYEDDSVFVRNDRLKCDYEILLDQRPYSDVVKMKPHRTEV